MVELLDVLVEWHDVLGALGVLGVAGAGHALHGVVQVAGAVAHTQLAQPATLSSRINIT